MAESSRGTAPLHHALAVEEVPDSDWNMPRCIGSSFRSETAREFRLSSEAIGMWKPWDEKGANGEDRGCGRDVLSVVLCANEGGAETEVEAAAAASPKSPLLSRATAGRDGNLPPGLLRAPLAVGTILFPILAIVGCGLLRFRRMSCFALIDQLPHQLSQLTLANRQLLRTAEVSPL